tara:strand:+ start:4324 stop:4935 length:612 start_codon:yes stop_codon:yes gene_type:complete
MSATYIGIASLIMMMLSLSSYAGVHIKYARNMHFGELEFVGYAAYGEVSLELDGSIWVSSGSNISQKGNRANPGHIIAKVSDTSHIKIKCHTSSYRNPRAKIINTQIYWTYNTQYYRCGDILHLPPTGEQEIELFVIADLLFTEKKPGQPHISKPLSIELEAFTPNKETSTKPKNNNDKKDKKVAEISLNHQKQYNIKDSITL